MLGTLPRREFRAGLYEVIKYGVIASRPLFESLGARSAALFVAAVDFRAFLQSHPRVALLLLEMVVTCMSGFDSSSWSTSTGLVM